MNYAGTLNAHALKAIEKNIDVPDYRLGIGEAEILSSQDVLIPDLMIPKTIADNLDNLYKYSNKELMQKISDNEIETNDLNANTTALGISGSVI